MTPTPALDLPDGLRRSLAGTSAVVAGAATDLGRAMTVALTEAGAWVYGLDVAEAIADLVTPRNVTLVPTDLGDDDEVAEAVRLATHDGTVLRVVVNCVEDDPDDGASRWDALRAAFTVLAAGTRQLAEAEPDADGWRGVIVNVSGLTAPEAQRELARFSRRAARDLVALGISVLAVTPGARGIAEKAATT